MAVKVYNMSFLKGLPAAVEADVSGMSVLSAIEHLESEYGAEIKSTMLTGGKLAEGYRILLNGSSVHEMDSLVPDGSQLMFTFVVVGG